MHVGVTTRVIDQQFSSDQFAAHLIPSSNQARQLATQALFRNSGCEDLTTMPVHRLANNVICTMPGKSDDVILVGAHFDKHRRGAGAIDNWTGVIILSELVRYHSRVVPEYTMKFVGFAEEEQGMKGSGVYVDLIRSGGTERPLAMINIDSIGLGELRVDRRSHLTLKCAAEQVGLLRGIEIGVSRMDALESDWVQFRRIGVPVLGIHSLDESNVRVIHSGLDQGDVVDLGLVEEAFGVVLGVLEVLEVLEGVDWGVVE